MYITFSEAKTLQTVSFSIQNPKGVGVRVENNPQSDNNLQ